MKILVFVLFLFLHVELYPQNIKLITNQTDV